MVIDPSDNVEVRADGHKYARVAISAGAAVIKYGMPIGHAVVDIAPGEHVHVHNLATNLDAARVYRYEPDACVAEPVSRIDDGATFMGYRRADGRAAVRNDIWIVPTVGCVNALCVRLAAACGGIALTHPYGCSQLGADHETTADILAALCRNPNAGGVLVVSLGCENNTLDGFAARLGFAPGARGGATGSFEPGPDAACNVRFLRAQDPGDEYARGLALLAELDAVRPKTREPISVSELVVGLKCGGSDGFSGLTANPLVGRFSDWLVARGGSAVLTEVPEMFGAEALLMRRCRTERVFERCVAMVDGFKRYYSDHGQPCHENPSPGNKAGGITTLEDKSLGCVQKGGTSPVEDVLACGARVRVRGLSLLSGPGNDLVSTTLLAAAGCHLVLFTTGRGTPFGSVVPTVKIASNDALAAAKPHWIDWNAMSDGDVSAFSRKVLAVASGERTRNEDGGDRGIAIFKDGVTL